MPLDRVADDYFAKLLGGIGSATSVIVLEVTYRDGTRPETSACHENVARWCRETGASSVPGWLVERQEYFPGHYRLVAHTVVETPEGKLFDLTPPNDGPERLFLRHPPGGLAFEDARRDRAVIIYPPLSR